jgi:hypothetical protein
MPVDANSINALLVLDGKAGAVYLKQSSNEISLGPIRVRWLQTR